MKHRIIWKLTAVLISAGIGAVVPAAAADSGMVFSMKAARLYLNESDLRDSDSVLDGSLRIDQYAGITTMKLHLVSDEPIRIENLDFARDSSRKEPDGSFKQCFFVSHGDSYVTRTNENGELLNKVLWYGSNNVPPDTGVVEQPESPFLIYQLRVPKGTESGVYHVGISKAVSVNEAGQNDYDFIVYNEDGKIDVPCEDTRVIVEPDAMRGDTDCDGLITPFDATAALCCASLATAGFDLIDPELETDLEEILKTPFIHTALRAADVDLNGYVEPYDASMILTYASQQIAGFSPEWDEIVR